MECQEAREIIENLVEGSAGIADQSLNAHLQSCSKCAGYLDELKRTWIVLGSYPSIKPAPDFDERLHRRIAGGQTESRHPRWTPVLGRQWAVIGACVLVFGILLTFHFSRTPALLEPWPGGLDAQDEVFLQDLDVSLQQTTADSLQVFDFWHEPASDISPAEQMPAEPAANSKERGKSPS